ncbi:MAG: SDR family NAD(P)-dependent oxidoreductase [Christensenellales bacterium]|jgi:3-oxoacyl-[acyl-carrier protein] reductase
MDLELKNKVAVVVGGSSNIGRACAVKLVEEGAKVVVNYSSNDEKAKITLERMAAVGDPENFCTYKCDIADEEAVDALFKFTVEKFGTVDILIFSAMHYPTNKVVDIPYDEWRRTMAVNIDGVFLTNKWLARYWTENKKPGWILNFASQAAYNGSTTHHAHYAASKGAVVAFSKSIARELGKYGIITNCVAPGMTAVVGEGLIDEKSAEYYKSRIPMGRIGTPEEMAEIVAFLVSPRNSYMLGACVDVNGGMLMR